MLATEIEVLYIMDSRHVQVWMDLKPDIYYKDGKPFGLISCHMEHGYLMVIDSLAKDDEHFTYAMIKKLVTTIKSHDRVMLMSTVEKSTAINKLMDKFVENGICSYFTKGI